MTALLDQLDELDRLSIAARKGMQSEAFISRLHDAVDKVKPVRMQGNRVKRFVTND